jgi:putative DNA primase/helicase
MNSQPIDDFRRVLSEAGLAPGEVIADGTLHRCPTTDKPTARDGWYVLHPDPPESGAFGNWRTGVSDTWTATEERTLTPQEREHLRLRVEADRKARQKAEQERHAEAAAKARSILAEAPDCQAHEYLTRKKVAPCVGLKLARDGRLVVPVLGGDGKAQSVQFIDQGGGKRFLTGGKVAGGFFAIKGKSGPLFLVEGLATGLTVAEATGRTVLCAFNAGNLLAVARMARKKYPERPIIVAADNDTGTDGNPGLTAGTAAALDVGGKLALPVFPEGAAGTDFNDLAAVAGVEEVRRQLAEAREPEPTKEEAPACKLVVVNVHDLLALDLPERGHVLCPVIPEQGLAMLYAPRGLGKTWAGLSIAYAVASGQKAFGRWEAPRPRRVLYLDGEMPANAMRDRFASIVAGYDAEPPDPDYLRLLTPDLQPDFMPNLAKEEGQAAVAPLLEGVELVVVDNLATLGRHGRENEAESWTPLQTWILALRRQGKSVLLIHHAGKGGNQRGTSAREDVLDTVIALRRPEDYEAEEGARFEVHLEKARGVCGPEARPFEAVLRLEGSAAQWLTNDLADVELERVRQLKAEGVSVRDIADETGMSKSRVQRMVKKLDGGRA